MSHAWTAPIMTAWSPPPSTAKEDLQHSKGSEKQWTCMRIATWGWQRHTPGISKSTKPLTVTDRDASRTLSCPPPWSQTTPYAKDTATVGAQHFPPNAMMRQNRKEKNSFTFTHMFIISNALYSLLSIQVSSAIIFLQPTEFILHCISVSVWWLQIPLIFHLHEIYL